MDQSANNLPTVTPTINPPDQQPPLVTEPLAPTPAAPLPEPPTQPTASANTQASIFGAVKGVQTRVQGTVEQFVQQVENPADLTARKTFGYKPTVQEQKQKAFAFELFERIWWVLALVVVAIILIWNWPALSSFYCLLSNCQPPATPPPATIAPIPTTNIVSTIFSGQAHEIEQDLGWLRQEFFQSIHYYEAGKAIAGSFPGATRYFAVVNQKSTGALIVYEFWQLADGEVVLAGGRPNVVLWLQNLQDYYLSQFFADKVRFQDEIASDFPQTIALNSTMILYRREVLKDLGPYDAHVYGDYRLELSLAPAEYQKLTPLQAVNYKDLTFYTKLYSETELVSQVAPLITTQEKATAAQYLTAGTKVIVTDSTGLAMVYELIFVDQWDNYRRTNLNTDLQMLEYYRQGLITYTATTAFGEYKARLLAGSPGDLPVGQPQTPVIERGLPGFVFTNAQFDLQAGSSKYAYYIGGLTTVCNRLVDGKVLTGVTKADLQEVGRISIPQTPLYRFKDASHPLVQLGYELKIPAATIAPMEYQEINFDLLIKIKDYQDARKIDRIREGKEPLELPTAAEYHATDPILVVFDPWERPILIWEADLEFSDKCVTIEGSISDERLKAY